jgi:hypothetical protein
MKIRASSLPLIAQCSQSANAPEVRIELGEASVPAMGSAVHAVIAERILGNKYDVGAIAERFQVDLAELEQASEIAMGSVSHVAKFFRRPASELALEHVEATVALTGHCDLAEYDPVTKEVRGLDFKTGWLDHDASQQCKAYAFLLMKHYNADAVWFGQVNVRSRSCFGHLWNRESLEAWWVWLKRHLAEQIYRPSYSACSMCRRWSECEAARSLTAVAIADLSTTDSRLIDTLTPEAAISVIERCRFLAKVEAQARELVKVWVAKHGGRVECEDGSYLELNKQNRRKVQFTMPAATILRKEIGDGIHELHLSVGEIEDLVGAKAPRGSKKWLIKRVMDALAEAGALQVEVSDRLDIRPAPKKIGVA